MINITVAIHPERLQVVLSRISDRPPVKVNSGGGKRNSLGRGLGLPSAGPVRPAVLCGAVWCGAVMFLLYGAVTEHQCNLCVLRSNDKHGAQIQVELQRH